jgi:hypothetical protein
MKCAWSSISAYVGVSIWTLAGGEKPGRGNLNRFFERQERRCSLPVCPFMQKVDVLRIQSGQVGIIVGIA